MDAFFQQALSMITPHYLKVWTVAKKAQWRLRHPVLTSEHLLFACLSLIDPRFDICKKLPVNANSVWDHLRDNPPVEEASEDICGLRLGVSAKAALDRADSEAAKHGWVATGSASLLLALLAESEGPVRTLLDAAAHAIPEKEL